MRAEQLAEDEDRVPEGGAERVRDEGACGRLPRRRADLARDQASRNRAFSHATTSGEDRSVALGQCPAVPFRVRGLVCRPTGGSCRSAARPRAHRGGSIGPRRAARRSASVPSRAVVSEGLCGECQPHVPWIVRLVSSVCVGPVSDVPADLWMRHSDRVCGTKSLLRRYRSQARAYALTHRRCTNHSRFRQ